MEDVLSLMNLDEVEWDGANPLGVEAAIADLRERKPHLFGRSTAPNVPDLGASNPGGGRPGAALTIADIRKMSPQEINARWPEVSAVLSK